MSIFFHNGTVWTGTGPEEDALLVRDGRVIAVGADATRLRAPEDAALDLEGGFLMPAFGDGHAHPIFGGLEAAGPQIRSCASVSEIVDEVRRFAAAHPELEWITGASYDSSLAADGLFDARWLDDAVPDRPVALRAWDYHTVWANSKALEIAGIDRDTPEPMLGVIPRRADGAPLGTLREWGAVELVTMHIPPRGRPATRRALQRAGEYYLRRGVTWVQDAWVEPDDLDTYLDAAREDDLPIRFNLALYADPRRWRDQLPWMRAARDEVDRAGHPHLTARTVKFFADGVIENETGALLQPYCSNLHTHGMAVWSPDELAEAVRAVDAAGFQVHVHAIGDAAVRTALDAIEHTVRVNGPRDRRPVIAHAQVVDDADLPRFGSLGVISNMQPLWAQFDESVRVLMLPRLGEDRSSRQYRMRSLQMTGATLAFGSDWPVSSGDPREGLATAISRLSATGEPVGGWMPEEIVAPEDALRAYTSHVAHQAFADGSGGWGAIAPGRSADLVHLAADPRTSDPVSIPAIAVRQTYLAGTPRLSGAADGA